MKTEKVSDKHRKGVLFLLKRRRHTKTERISNKGENPADRSELTKNKAKQEVIFYCCWKMSWISLIQLQHMQILVLKKLQTKKYRDTFVSMLTERKIPQNLLYTVTSTSRYGTKVLIHTCNFSTI